MLELPDPLAPRLPFMHLALSIVALGKTVADAAAWKECQGQPWNLRKCYPLEIALQHKMDLIFDPLIQEKHPNTVKFIRALCSLPGSKWVPQSGKTPQSGKQKRKAPCSKEKRRTPHTFTFKCLLDVSMFVRSVQRFDRERGVGCQLLGNV